MRLCLGRGGEVRIDLRVGQRADRAAESRLAAQRLPVEKRGGFRMGGEFASLGAFDIAVESQTAGVHALAEKRPDVGQSVLVDRRKRHRLGIVDLGLDASSSHSRKSATGSSASVKSGCVDALKAIPLRFRVQSVGRSGATVIVAAIGIDNSLQLGEASGESRWEIRGDWAGLAGRPAKAQIGEGDIGVRAPTRRAAAEWARDAQSI